MDYQLQKRLKFFQKSFFKRDGFSLLEVMVSLAIISIIAVIAMVNYQLEIKPQIILREGSQQIINDIYKTKSLAISTVGHNGVIPLGGYGINFNNSSVYSYIIFADDNNNKIYDGISEKVEEVSLPSNIKITNLSFKGSSTSVLNIVFLPPDPVTFSNTDNNYYNVESKITIAIEGQEATFFKRIVIRNSGYIGIEN